MILCRNINGYSLEILQKLYCELFKEKLTKFLGNIKFLKLDKSYKFSKLEIDNIFDFFSYISPFYPFDN